MMTSIAGPAYRIITPRLVIRCPELSDASALDIAISQNLDHLRPWMEWANDEPVTMDERIAFLRRTRGNFDLGIDFGYLVFDQTETIILGGTGLHTWLGAGVREIGYWIHKDHINQGFATEVSAALTRVAFEVEHVRRVEIHCSPKNVRSASIPRKLAYILEATLHDRVEDVEGGFRDAMIWSMFVENYPSSPSAKLTIRAFDAIGRQIV